MEIPARSVAGEQPSEASVFGDETGGTITNVKIAWPDTCARAGIKNLRFQDLRHEFASTMLDAGLPPDKVRDRWAQEPHDHDVYANTTGAHPEGRVPNLRAAADCHKLDTND